MKVLVDLLLIILILACAWAGYKKGLVMGVAGILMLIVSIYMANLVSTTFSYEVIPALRPFVSGYMEPKISDSVYELMGYEKDVNGNYPVDVSADDLVAQNPDKLNDVCKSAFKSLGIYDTTAGIMADEAEKDITTDGVNFSDAIVNIMCQKISYYMGFILTFAIFAILLTVLGNIFNLNYKLPAMNRINDIGGIVTGTITGFMLCTIIVWAVKFIGILIHEETLSGSLIASFFLKLDILTRSLGI